MALTLWLCKWPYEMDCYLNKITVLFCTDSLSAFSISFNTFPTHYMIHTQKKPWERPKRTRKCIAMYLLSRCQNSNNTFSSVVLGIITKISPSLHFWCLWFVYHTHACTPEASHISSILPSPLCSLICPICSDFLFLMNHEVWLALLNKQCFAESGWKAHSLFSFN